MSTTFLRTYALLAAAALVAVLATHAIITRQTRRVIDERIEQMAQLPADVLRARAEHHERHAQRPPGPPPALGDGPQRGRAPFGVAPLAALDLSASERAELDAGEVVTRRRGGMRESYYALDETTAVVFGPVPEGLPRRTLQLQLLTLLAMLAAIGVALWALQRPLDRRIQRLADTADRLAQGERQARAGVTGDDAIGRLGERFDAMAEQLAAQIARRDELLRSVSHELRTPLARIVLLHEQLEERDAAAADRPAADASGPLARMKRSLDEMNLLLGELLDFARLDAQGSVATTAPVDLTRLAVREAAELADDTVSIEVRNDLDVQVQGDVALLQRALRNLLVNARRHARTRVVIELRRLPDHVEVRVDDDGAGVAEAERERIFEPFVRLDDAPRRGSAGLGLPIARRAVEAHGGALVCTESPLGGARFVLTLPGQRRAGASVA